MSKAKQGYLEGQEPPTIQEIDEAAEAYYALNDKSWKLRSKVKEAADELLEIMKKHGLTTYQYENKEVDVLEKEVVKVKKKTDREDE